MAELDSMAKTPEKISLMKKYFTEEVSLQISPRKSSYGACIGDCIQSGIENPDSDVGLYATDPDAYHCFRELFFPIIEDIHQLKGGMADLHYPGCYFGDLSDPGLDLTEYDQNNEFIISTRIRAARNLEGFPFTTFASKADRLAIETKLEESMKNLPPHLQGTYQRLSNMSDVEQVKLIRSHLLFRNDDRFLRASGCYTDWPWGRGIFRSTSGKLQMWVNEEDQLRVISMSKGCNVVDVFSTLKEALEAMEEIVKFCKDSRFGYLTTCPSNLGTTIRASVLIRLPKLAALPNFKTICSHLMLDVRGTHGEKSEVTDHVFDLSNKQHLGLREYDAVCQMVQGVRIIILLEQSLP